MVDKRENIPDNMTIAEASAYWDNASVSDHDSHIVEFEYTPDDHITIVTIASDMAQKVEQQARANGISVETLVNLWIQEKLTAVSP
jgi:predicted DNA binding CopG/RHH family protein